MAFAFRPTLTGSILLLLALAITGCGHFVQHGKFVPTRALVVRHLDLVANPTEDSKNNFEQNKKVISDPAEVRQLASFFPGLGSGWSAPVEASYMPWVEISFEQPNGRSVKVSTDYVYWTEGKGDSRVGSGFADYIDRLFGKMPATAASSAPGTRPAR